jgi:hypothetical protein
MLAFHGRKGMELATDGTTPKIQSSLFLEFLHFPSLSLDNEFGTEMG